MNNRYTWVLCKNVSFQRLLRLRCKPTAVTNHRYVAPLLVIAQIRLVVRCVGAPITFISAVPLFPVVLLYTPRHRLYLDQHLTPQVTVLLHILVLILI